MRREQQAKIEIDKKAPSARNGVDGKEAAQRTKSMRRQQHATIEVDVKEAAQRGKPMRRQQQADKETTSKEGSR